MSFYSIYAIIPYYTRLGENATYLILADGTIEHLTCSIHTYIRHMLYNAHLDPRALRYWTHKVTGQKLNTPLILNDQLIYIPIKMRHAIGKTDGCFGYILSSAITSFDDATLTLQNDTILTTSASKNYLIKKQKDAMLLKYAYLDHRKQFDYMHN